MHLVQVHRSQKNQLEKEFYQDCTSRRIWGSLFHIGVAGFVAKLSADCEFIINIFDANISMIFKQKRAD